MVINQRTVQGWGARVLLALAALVLAAAASADPEFPATTPDGLKLVRHTDHGAVYIKPGAKFGGYDKVAILNCFVSFKKHWMQDQNEQLPMSVSPEDVKRIKDQISQDFKQVFTKVLQKKGETVVDDAAADVLVLRPAIVNLDIQNPDTPQETMDNATVFGPSGGDMTLYLELYDSLTSDLLARVMDAEPLDATGTWMVRNTVTNQADADQVMQMWADRLGNALDKARAAAKAASN